MKGVRIGFHLVMLALLVMTFAGVFSPPKSGSFVADNTGYIMPAIGVVTIWLVGAIALKVIGAFVRK
ncbi:MAG: hypothetical protein ACOY4O_16755 [Pseudomonadota bacterium]